MDCQYPKLRGIRLPRVLSGPRDIYWVFDVLPILEFVEYTNRDERALERLYRPASVQWTCGHGQEWLADWEAYVVHIGDEIRGIGVDIASMYSPSK
ncbi:hypothetical protein BDN71DRAFT_1509358 [Pleurotus eryngii]|uniref:Uncharacterized protein n=1 Tax=Pleurotus eryngii TaxID=5323 RepID=A0A9P5ZQE9_PLEER|nr:hypothetical protein BDN71DRAFT_1509358 [Pleurotus eryngii]